MRRVGSRTSRRRGDAGTAVVEAAIVAPVFFLLLLALLEYGLVFKDKMSVNNGANAAARQASANGSDALADYSILVSARNDLSALDRAVDRIVVFKATSREEAVPAACLGVSTATLPAGIAGLCNVYNASALTRAKTDFGFDAIYRPDGDLLDKYWAPTSRLDSAGTTEYIGVYVEATHVNLTGILPSDVVMKSTIVVPYEARGS
ncbi:MAG: TadE/TadG family type IV pilus assembly protein [Acidimicrobiia bacterium]